MLDLFVGDFSNEVVQHFSDGVHRSVVFQLRFNLGQEGHDGSLGRVVDGEFVEQTGGTSACNESNQADGESFHFFFQK